MSSNLTTLETYVHIFSLNKIKILSFILLALKSGLAKKRINFYFSNCVCVCPAELLTFSAEVISFWKEFLEGNRVPLRLSSLNLLASFPIFTVLHHPSYPFWSFNFSLSLSLLSPIPPYFVFPLIVLFRTPQPPFYHSLPIDRLGGWP